MRFILRTFAVLLCMTMTSCSMLSTTITGGVTHAETTTIGESDTVLISREEYERLLAYQELYEIQSIVDAYYYEDVDDETLLEGAAAGMLAYIGDPYTFYYTPEEYAEMWEDDEGEYAGVGMLISGSYETGLCTISRVFEGSPALEAGIHRGDVLIKVDDLDVNVYNLQDAVDIMRGEVGKTVNITMLRGEEEISFVVTRAVINVNYVSSTMLENNIGYISLYQFSGNCSQQFIAQADELVKQGAKALIIDLRDNPGGWTSDAQTIADHFLGKGVLCTIQYKDGSTEVTATTDSSSDLTLPLVVLVNENSASSSEILTGALQDRERATIVGTKTYGKGIVQWVLDVGSRGAGMQLTIAQYMTPNGNKVHKVGLTPDVVVEMPEDEVSVMFELGDLADTQLKVAYDVAIELAGQ